MMTDPHEKAVEDRKKAAEDVKTAYEELCEAADLYEPET